jgi:hypothetical protein
MCMMNVVHNLFDDSDNSDNGSFIYIIVFHFVQILIKHTST